MLNREQARELVVAELERLQQAYPDTPTDVVIMDDVTIEKEWGWVFFYQSERYLKTKEFSYMLFGNAPYIVNRLSGEMRITGTAHPIEYYIEDYEKLLQSRTEG